ncbi:MAG: hypothetical protein ACI8P7_000186 [Candidatus Azotimanducaceae bacterium]|jgi:hypothetical protein
MIKHTLIDTLVHISIDNMDFSYRIPTKKLGTTRDWTIGEKGTKGITYRDVSSWALQLFTKSVTESKYVKQFKSIVEEHAPSNDINWDETFSAINLQNKYNWLVESNKTAKKKVGEADIILRLKKKYNLD